MNRFSVRCISLLVLVPFAIAATSPKKLCAQESVRNIDQPGDYNKYLTPGMVDRWIFGGKKDETIIAHVATREFDSVIQLVQTVEDKEKFLQEIDDDGSDSWLSFRLPEDGEYRICVRGYEFKGGGNYSLSLRQFRAQASAIGSTVAGTFDGGGKAFFRFAAERDQSLTVDVTSSSLRDWAVLDPQGKQVDVWERLAVPDRSGEYLVELTGRAGHRFELALRPTIRHRWTDDEKYSGSLDRRQAAIIDLDGQIGDFRVIELATKDQLSSQIIFAPIDVPKGQRLDNTNGRPETAFLPIGSKGEFTRYAAIWGRKDRYQLWVFSDRGGSYTVRNADLATGIESDGTTTDRIEVGGTRFFHIHPEQGQTITMNVSSEGFDPVVRLFNDLGSQVEADDDGAGGLNSRLQHTSYSSGPMLLSVASVGDGGGGEFQLSLRTEEAMRLESGEKQSRQTGVGGIEHWLFAGKKDQTVIFHASGGDSQPNLVLRNSQGVELASSTSGNKESDVVMLHTFTGDGNYSIWVSLPAGDRYTIRAIDTN